MGKQDREKIKNVMANEGAIEVVRFIKNNTFGAYFGEIQRELTLPPEMIKKRLDELREVGLIKAVPDTIIPKPGGNPITVSRYEVSGEYKWVLNRLFKEE